MPSTTGNNVLPRIFVNFAEMHAALDRVLQETNSFDFEMTLPQEVTIGPADFGPLHDEHNDSEDEHDGTDVEDAGLDDEHDDSEDEHGESESEDGVEFVLPELPDIHVVVPEIGRDVGTLTEIEFNSDEEGDFDEVEAILGHFSGESGDYSSHESEAEDEAAFTSFGRDSDDEGQVRDEPEPPFLTDGRGRVVWSNNRDGAEETPLK